MGDILTTLESVEQTGYLSLLPNPFRVPPEAVVREGMGSVKGYFTALFAEGHTMERRDIKVVIAGKAGAGKTKAVGAAAGQRCSAAPDG